MSKGNTPPRMQTTDSLPFLGKQVTVTIDRPLGSAHPKYGWTYPVNYGYVPGTLSGDGEDLDAYVLGVHRPVDNFEGHCVAVLRRNGEADDKLIVVEEGLQLTEAEIRSLVDFQERYFESTLVMATA